MISYYVICYEKLKKKKVMQRTEKVASMSISPSSDTSDIITGILDNSHQVILSKVQMH